MAARILVIEDEAPIRRGLCDVLTFHGHDPHGVADGSEGLDVGLRGGWDLLLVDVMLPGLDGFSICREIRAHDPRLAVLLLTARGNEEDVLAGFAAGADDYVTKPFSVAQLLARVDALLRRSGPTLESRFRLGALTIDPNALRAEGPGGRADLTRRDVALLIYLTGLNGRVASREDLLRDVWDYQCVERVETRCVDMHVSKLRRRLAALVDDDIIETIRGAGYRVAGGPP